MNVEIDANGVLKILPPRSKAGDSIVLRAEMDLIAGLTACSAEMSNNYRFKPIAFKERRFGNRRPKPTAVANRRSLIASTR
jgi:uncharacterized protein YcgI (DUF1989 family)